MMMTTEELKERLEKIDKKLELIVYKGEPDLLYLVDGRAGHPTIYDFTSQKYNAGNCLNYIPDKIHDLNKLLDEYYEGRNEILAHDSEDSVDSTDRDNLKLCNNSFKEYTDHLAQTLLDKNKAYGDSFTKSVDTYGLSVIGVRLSDKYNRIEHLINENMFTENGESLQDTLLDMAGYSILALKYLKEHENA
ncbi:nucleotide modification associated domain-containing protein [Lactobacillus acidophilus]|uniref:nucleotide modification associated domain-containing protein n=1 Tax=Lactobacillus acidophilus TaxID=1579 RepID=UPI001F4A013C|nr:nucleotide modification associated domain-containing protein [Lactobacillus acidophilus]